MADRQDATEPRKTAEQEMREAKEYAESIAETLHEPLLVLTPTLRVKSFLVADDAAGDTYIDTA